MPFSKTCLTHRPSCIAMSTVLSVSIHKSYDHHIQISCDGPNAIWIKVMCSFIQDIIKSWAFVAYAFSQSRDRETRSFSLRSTGQDTSTDMHLWSAWPSFQVKPWPLTFHGQRVQFHGSMRLDGWNTIVRVIVIFSFLLRSKSRIKT